MKFNQNKFLTTNFKPRTAEVEVPELKDMFDDLKKDQVPVIVVKSLTRVDMVRMQEAADTNSNLKVLLEAVGGGNAKEAIEGLKQRLGIGEDLPEQAAREIVMVQAGCSEPEINLETAVKLYDTFPMVCTRLITEISRLTSAGWEPGKPGRSIAKPELKTA